MVHQSGGVGKGRGRPGCYDGGNNKPRNDFERQKMSDERLLGFNKRLRRYSDVGWTTSRDPVKQTV